MFNLVVLAGWTRDERSYKKLIEKAPSNWKVFIPSYKKLQPNKGLSVFNTRFSEFLKGNNFNKVILVGHSLGAILAVHYVLKNPQTVERLFLIDSVGMDNKGFWQTFIRFLKENKRKGFITNAVSVFRTLKNPFLNFNLALFSLNTRIDREVRNLKVQTTIIWGEEDLISPLSSGKKLEKLIPKSKLIVLKQMHHDWLLSHPDLFWKELLLHFKSGMW